MQNHSSSTKKYFSPPNISHARFGWKGIAVNKDANTAYIAGWINMTPDDQTGWKKIFDVYDTGFSPTGPRTASRGSNIQIRIDGISSHPTFTKPSFREVVWSQASADATTATGAPV